MILNALLGTLRGAHKGTLVGFRKGENSKHFGLPAQALRRVRILRVLGFRVYIEGSEFRVWELRV